MLYLLTPHTSASALRNDWETMMGSEGGTGSIQRIL